MSQHEEIHKPVIKTPSSSSSLSSSLPSLSPPPPQSSSSSLMSTHENNDKKFGNNVQQISTAKCKEVESGEVVNTMGGNAALSLPIPPQMENTTTPLREKNQLETPITPMRYSRKKSQKIEDTSKKQDYKGHCSKHLWNVLILGVSFMTILTAFNTTQFLMTSIHKEGGMGFISLGVLYGVFSFSNFISPTIESLLGPRPSLVLSAIPYALFVLSSGFSFDILLICSSVLLGFGAALLWTAHGDMLTRCGQGRNMEFYSGIFFGIFQLNGILGNIIYGYLKSINLPQWLCFTILFGIALCGIAMLLLLCRIDKPNVQKFDDNQSTCARSEVASTSALYFEDEEENQGGFYVAEEEEGTEIQTEVDEEEYEQRGYDIIDKLITFVSSIFKTLSLLIDKRMLLLTALHLYSGYSISFFSGTIPPHYPQHLLPWLLAMFGAAEAIGSLSFGRLATYFGKRYMIWITLVLHSVSIVLAFYIHNFKTTWLYFLSQFIFGLSDSGMNTQIYGILGYFFQNRASDAFADFKFIQSIAMTAGFLSGLFLAYNTILYLMIALLVTAWVKFLILDLFVQSVDHKRSRPRLKNLQQDQ